MTLAVLSALLFVAIATTVSARICHFKLSEVWLKYGRFLTDASTLVYQGNVQATSSYRFFGRGKFLVIWFYSARPQALRGFAANATSVLAGASWGTVTNSRSARPHVDTLEGERS